MKIAKYTANSFEIFSGLVGSLSDELFFCPSQGLSSLRFRGKVRKKAKEFSMSLCPCGSGLELEACCGPYIEGSAKAPTAEALMRSRYTAHVLKRYQYLTDSTHPEFREDASADEIEKWSSMLTWEGLEIFETVDGGENDSTGEVKFSAHYSVQNVPQELREDAFFRKEGDTWYYVEGSVYRREPVRRAAPKIGPNQPCPCGSGKKYKKCCGKGKD